MKKNLSTGRIMRLAMALLLLTIGGISTTLHAQRNDGFFRSNNNDDVYNDRDAKTPINGGGFTNNPMNQQDPNSPAPIGSGLLIMVAAGAGYAVIRRKKTVRKSAALLMAGVLILGFTQCRKKDVATIVDNTANLVPMTLTTDGAKTSFDDGVISWVSDDKLNVVAGGKCIGTLTYDGNDFSGHVDLDAFSESDETTFYFYYVGNQTIASGETSFTMSMSGQTGAQADLGNFHVSKGLQSVIIKKSGMNVSATLRSYTSVAYFNVSGFNRYSETGENLYMYGNNIYEQLTINFSDNSITPEHDGYYISAGTSADKANAYYMFIPTSADGQTEVNHVVNFVNKRTSATTTFKYGIVSNGWYCNGGFDEPIDVTGDDYYQGTLRGLFSVDKPYNQDPKKVRFSQGNLQYNAYENKWQFADNQYSYIGNNPGNSTDPGSDPETDNRSNQDAWIDLFNWGASGYDNKYPYIIYPKSYSAPTSIANTNYDWGVNNAIYNGGNIADKWYTMSSSYWNTILNNTSYRPSDRYIKAKIEDTYGLIIFADNYEIPGGISYSGTNTSNTSWNTCWDATDAWDIIEAAGAVFLPAAGHSRYYTSFGIVNCNSIGKYWTSATNNSNSNTMTFLDTQIQYNNSTVRNMACSVRLVKNVE